ncbi:MAG: hypothetical protein WAZ97_13235, partial [Pseudolabrys sp.]
TLTMACKCQRGAMMLKRKWKEEAAATPLTGLAIGVKIQLRIGTQTLAFRLDLLGSSELGVADDRSQ